MRKLGAVVVLSLAGLCAGCGSDQNDILVSETISLLGSTTRTIEQIKDELTQTVDEAKKDNRPLSRDKILAVATKAEELKKEARKLQAYKTEVDFRKDKITPDQREQYAQRHGESFRAALQKIGEVQYKLSAALKDAEIYNDSLPEGEGRENGTAALADLKKKLEEGQREFEVLTKT